MSEPRSGQRTAGFTAAALIAFASNSLLCRGALAHAHADAATFTLLRLTSGAALLSWLARGETRSEADRPSGPLAGIWLAGYALGFSFAYGRIPTGTGALLLFASVQLTMLAAGLRAGERPRAREWLGLLLSLAGLVVLTRPGLGRPDPLGALLMVAAGISWGLYSLRGRGSRTPIRSNAHAFRAASAPALLAWVLALRSGGMVLDRTGALLAVGSGALASGVGYALWYRALPALRRTQAALVQLAVPPLAALGGVLLLGESFVPRLAAASALVLGGIALAALRPAGEVSSRAR